MRIAMWSGPRNLSTAMMYAFDNRADCAAIDEPFYAAYLAATGLDHPMREEILAAQPTDPNEVVSALTGSVPGGKAHFYQKLMCHHMVPGVPRGWMTDVVNVFLIRHPARVIASYGAKRENPSLDDIAFWQQAELYDQVGGIVIDSHDIRDDPEGMLRALCAEIGLDFDPAMLNWPAGGRGCDGVWAPHWYNAVWKSTGFAGREGPLPEIPADLRAVSDAALPYYERMAAKALRS
ncbi:HAD family hydrolase [Tropicimonas sp. IMCC6043]|uniref:sulfotransferase-like domain-containing protein n=1 Tax=Tropicimonas sp. IMCC6043 TaxID=2510645 RepID=UPI00101D2FE3|nr:HAD family hydrolase [Tropicimonas sp. IMCC6043]RYH10835.1 HAD family hydrolase [Tropicimonas sp. IMCC6043]